MSGLLIRVLSTGKTGTKFLSNVFADQGYFSYHENLYLGEPYSAVTQYLHMLSDLWKKDREAYYALHSDFADPYVGAVAELLTPTPGKGTRKWRSRLRDRFGAREEKRGYVIHTAHNLTPATPLIERALEKASIESHTLILYRNPLKTIHALYLVEGKFAEGQVAYRMRPPSFSQGDEGIFGAASVWANLYQMAMDQSRHYGPDKFRLLELERFSGEINYAEEVFGFCGLDFDGAKFARFSQQELSKPLRGAKIDSVRNSHLFHNPDFVFSADEREIIRTRISEVLRDYSIDWERCVDDYVTFHGKEKARLGFESV
jgi:hypothetical protein